MWGIIPIDYMLHVVPVDEGHKLKVPHEPHEFCICDPKIKEVEGQLIIIHNEES